VIEQAKGYIHAVEPCEYKFSQLLNFENFEIIRRKNGRKTLEERIKPLCIHVPIYYYKEK
jgi:hypothetical protein